MGPRERIGRFVNGRFWWLSAAPVLEQICGRYGCDLLLRLEAKTLGVWGTPTSFSHQAGEFRLIPSADSLNGSALCTQVRKTPSWPRSWAYFGLF